MESVKNDIFDDQDHYTIISNNFDSDEIQRIGSRDSFSMKMQRSLKKVRRSIQKITETSSTVQPHCVFVESLQDDEKQPPYILPERLSFLMYQTGFSKDEIRKLYRAFKQHCPRGAVTTNDLKPAYAKLFPLGDPARYTQIVFNIFDKDGDGIVSFADLLIEAASIINGDVDRKLQWIFRFYDLNGDGYITRKEMLIIVSAIYEMLNNGHIIQRIIDRHVDKVFEKMDADKDGDSTIQNQLAIFDHFW
ncbi:hippocalcin-like protein 4 isoform X3 [Ceratina calcarata]|uniref:Hippocalcin-like protein 4 isoform X3 n=1 Tax=Ceratina calcarata TaxID=156304 RepID=A0AAJ7W8G4_9HYME|nr:hippocalcin-like protein 4 isoform X3 [Ceratina calcarata]